MTKATTEIERVPETSPELATRAPDPAAEERKSRLWLPLLLPLGAILAVAFVAINISRVFLAASKHDSTPAVIIGAGITVAILAGATILAAFPKIRTSSLFLVLGGALLVVLLAGSLVLGAAEPEEEAGGGGYVEPAGAAVNTLTVDALPTLKFQADNFDVPGGINLIEYVDKGGTHTLLFDGAFPGFKLAVPTGLKELKADLEPGKTYTIYCDIPGHRQAGMEATITVGEAGTATAAATETPSSTTPASETSPTTTAGSSEVDPAQQSGDQLGN